MLLKVTPGDEDPLAAEGLAAAGLLPEEFFPVVFFPVVFFPGDAFLAFCGDVG